MKILIISFPFNELCLGGEEQIALSLKQEFDNLGHITEICSRENFNNYEDFDFIISLNIPIKINSKKNKIWMTWVFNSNLGNTAEEILKYNFDLHITNSSFIFNSLTEKGFKVKKMDIPPSPSYIRKNKLIDPNQKKTDILYLGNYNPEYKTLDRINDYLLPCISNKYNFEIYGYKWKLSEQRSEFDKGKFNQDNFVQFYEPYSSGILPLESCDSISDLSKIFINFHSPDQLGMEMINNRMFDLILNGCFVITDDSLSQRELFGDIVEYSSGKNDLRSKIDFYLNNQKEIVQKQKLALEFGNNYYKNNNYKIITLEMLKMVEEYKEFKSSSLILKNIKFAVIVNDLTYLQTFIKGVKNDIGYIFYVHKSNRIHAQKIIGSNHKVVLFEDDIESFRIPLSDYNIGDIVIPTYCNFSYESDFTNKIKESFDEMIDSVILKFDVVDTVFKKRIYGSSYKLEDNTCYNYGTYALNINDKFVLENKTINFEFFKDLNQRYSDNISANVFFDSDDKRSLFVKNNIIDKSEEKIIENDIILKRKEIDIINLRLTVFYLKNDNICEINYANIEFFCVENKNIEELIREAQSHYTLLVCSKLNIKDVQRLLRLISSHMNYDSFKFGDNVFIKTSKLFQYKPFSDLNGYRDWLFESGLSIIDIDPFNYDIKIIKEEKTLFKNNTGLKISALSMCGVSNYEDKYGIGGEHQVIHWLKDSLDKREDVYKCNIFDTQNFQLMGHNNDYDIIFSNSCWRDVSRYKRKDALSIFWHFNMNPGNVMETIERLNYDMVWTNSPVALEWFKNKNIPCLFKHLNASSEYHYPYQWKSSLYNEDVVYLGGYSPFYKSKELIDLFIKPCINKDWKFSIYGNRLWKSEVQRQALKNDSFFKAEYYDETYDPYYRSVLPMQDYNILGKNAKIWLNANAFSQKEMKMTNDRVIWGCACNIFFITDDTEEARDFYESNGKDKCPVVFSEGGDDLVKKIEYYLNHDDERLEIASRGREFIKSKKLFTDDTVDLIIETYRNHART